VGHGWLSFQFDRPKPISGSLMVWIRGEILTVRLLSRHAKARLARSNGLRLTAVQQTPAILQQPINAREVVELPRIRVWNDLGLQFQGAESLLQANQALGQGSNGLGEILGGTRDPEGQGIRCHR
jgi:hypothetical protein